GLDELLKHWSRPAAQPTDQLSIENTKSFYLDYEECRRAITWPAITLDQGRTELYAPKPRSKRPPNRPTWQTRNSWRRNDNGGSSWHRQGALTRPIHCGDHITVGSTPCRANNIRICRICGVRDGRWIHQESHPCWRKNVV